MTDFMTAPPVIHVQPTCPGDQRAKDVQVKSSCKLCRERRKTQVWLCFLVLSTLSTASAAFLKDKEVLEEVLACLGRLQPALKKSDAMLYTPSDIHKECRLSALKCYMLELRMVIEEELQEEEGVKKEMNYTDINSIIDFNEKLPEDEADNVGCLPCEAHSLGNITIFLDGLNNFLQEVNMAIT